MSGYATGASSSSPSWTAMASEIRETPGRVAALLVDSADEILAAGATVERAAPRWAVILGGGTSDHAATYGRYLLEALVGIPAGLGAPSVASGHGAMANWSGGIVVALSPSGRSPDAVSVVSAARSGGAVTIAITNDPESPLAAAAECVIDCRAGPERSAAATKSYVAQLVAIAALVARLRPDTGLGRELPTLPAALRRAIERTEAWLATVPVVEDLAAADRALVVSRGFNLATALEVASKLKEIGGLVADAYSTTDLQHRPIALAAADVPVLALRPPGEMGARVEDVVTRMETSHGGPWSIAANARGDGTRRRDGASARLASHGRTLDLASDLPDALSPAMLVVPGQLLAEAVARRRGVDPDAPPASSSSG